MLPAAFCSLYNINARRNHPSEPRYLVQKENPVQGLGLLAVSGCPQVPLSDKPRVPSSCYRLSGKLRWLHFLQASLNFAFGPNRQVLKTNSSIISIKGAVKTKQLIAVAAASFVL